VIAGLGQLRRATPPGHPEPLIALLISDLPATTTHANGHAAAAAAPDPSPHSTARGAAASAASPAPRLASRPPSSPVGASAREALVDDIISEVTGLDLVVLSYPSPARAATGNTEGEGG